MGNFLKRKQRTKKGWEGNVRCVKDEDLEHVLDLEQGNYLIL
jgi:hypothetical protein